MPNEAHHCVLLAALACAVACGSEAPPAAERPPVAETPNQESTTPVASAPQPSEEPPIEAAPPPPAEIARAQGEVDANAGPDDVVLMSDGALHVGELRGIAELSPASEAYPERWTVSVVVIDRRAHMNGVLVTARPEGEEDPATRFQLFVVDGTSLRRVLDLMPGFQDVARLRFPGNGTVTYVETGRAACERAGEGATRAPRDEVTYRIDPEGAATEPTRRPSREVQRCEDLIAACPYVYLVRQGVPELVGEILRDLRGRDAYAAQTLALGENTSGPVHVRLREEKDEVTYLDRIAIDVDGVRVEPQSCADVPRPAYCDEDGVPFVLAQGDQLDLVFDAAPGSVLLRATGYYVPR